MKVGFLVIASVSASSIDVSNWDDDASLALLQLRVAEHKSTKRQPTCTFVAGDGTGGREQNIGSASSPAQCEEMVRAQCPDANGVTMPPSGVGSCYCEFGWTGSNGSGGWQTCQLDAEPVPEATCTFIAGDGNGRREQNIGSANSPAECEQMVRAQCPDANGVTMPPSGVGSCYCEFGQTGSNGSGGWQNCQLDATTTTTIPDVNDEASAVGDPHMQLGNGGSADICCEGRVCKPCVATLIQKEHAHEHVHRQ